MNLKTAEKLARLRREHGYSQEELAERLGVSRQAVSKWERGESSPDTDNLIALAEIYGVTLDELLNYDAEKRGKRGGEEEAEDARGEFFSVRADSGEEVHLGADGLHVDDGKGNRVEIASPFKINIKKTKKYCDDCKGDYNDCGRDCDYKEGADGTTININNHIFTRGKSGASHRVCAAVGALHGVIFILTLTAFLLWGFLGGDYPYEGAWGLSWLVWFAWPILASLTEAIAYRDANRFAFPILVVAVFLTLGMVLNLWHPAWVVFFSIPVYYFIVDIIKKIAR